MNKLLLIIAIGFAFTCNLLNAQTWTNVVVSLTGSVVDEATRKPISVDINITDSEGKRVNRAKSNSADGYYYLTGLRPDKVYTVTITNPKYFKEEITIRVPATDKYLEISRDILVKPLAENVRIPFMVSPFEVNQSRIRFGADMFLKDVKNSLKLNPNVKFEIHCFPDSERDAATNLNLTEARANALKEYFVSNGINADRITISGSRIVDVKNPPPVGKASKGKCYIGPSYIVIKGF